MPQHEPWYGEPLSEAELAESSIVVPVPHGAEPVRLPVVVRHGMHDVVSPIAGTVAPDTPTDPVHTFVLEIPQPADEDCAAAHDAFLAALRTPGVVVRRHAEQSLDDDPPDDLLRRRMIECARVRVRAHSELRRVESGGSWKRYLAAFGISAEAVGYAVDAVIDDGLLDADFDTPVRIDRVFRVLSVDVHPAFRGQRLGARLLMHALRRLITAPTDLVFLRAVASRCRYQGATDPDADRPELFTASAEARARRAALMAYAGRLLLRPWAEQRESDGSFKGVLADALDDLAWAVGADLLPDIDIADVAGAPILDTDAGDDGDPDDADVFGAPVDGGGIGLTWPHGVLPPRAKIGVHGRIADIDLAALNPVCVGVGHFSGWISVERYAHTVTAVAERHGLRDTLAAMRDAVLCTFPRELTSVAMPSWVATAAATAERVGIPRFVATFVTRLRVELD